LCTKKAFTIRAVNRYQCWYLPALVGVGIDWYSI